MAASRERVCCLLVLNSVTSTPQWIRQPKPRSCVQSVRVFVCESVLERSRVSQPLNLGLCLLQHFGVLTSLRASRCHLSSSRLLQGAKSRSNPRAQKDSAVPLLCVFYYCRTYYKAVCVGWEESGGRVLWDQHLACVQVRCLFGGGSCLKVQFCPFRQSPFSQK